MSLAKSGVTISAVEQAPFIYFDGVSCFGQHNGSIQIELAAHVLVPDGGGVKIDVIQTAHFRCSTSAALLLRDVLDKTLAMVQKGQSEAQLISPLKN
jgi:hypothetical protein